MRVLPALVLLLLAGCASAPPPGPPAAFVPDLLGTWTGTWGGSPATLLLTAQHEGHGESGLVLGPWQVFGEVYPVATGVLTARVDGEMVSTSVSGRISDAGAGPVLTVLAQGPSAGEQWLRLRLVGEDRLEGTGESQHRWGPRGAVLLVRQRPR